jgi:hypothetical protein
MNALLNWVLGALLLVTGAALVFTELDNRKLSAELNTVRTQAQNNQLRAVTEARATERADQTSLQEALDVQTEKARVARADADDARGALERLRQRARAVAVHADLPQAPEAAGGCQADRDAAARLSDALGRTAERARWLAAALDDSIAAGQLCERAYQGLTDAEVHDLP